MSDPIFGIAIRTLDDEARPIIGADLSTIAIVGPNEQVDNDIFPLDTPILLYSNDTTIAGQLYRAGGWIRQAVEGINAQLGDFQFAARIVIVRTASNEETDPAIKIQKQIAAIVGSSTLGTGIWALLKSPDLLGVIPRLVLVPGFTGQLANGIASVTVGVHGTGYDPLATIPVTFTGGAGNVVGNIVPATGVAVVGVGGQVNGVTITNPGQWYVSPPNVIIPAPTIDPTGGVQATGVAIVSQLGNPVCAALPAVLNQLLGHAIVESSGISQVNDQTWRNTLNSQRLIPMSGGAKVINGLTGVVEVQPVAPMVAGIGVRVDHEKGAPFHSWANRPMQGVVGPGRDMKFVITDGANEGQTLLSHNIGIVIRGEGGNDFALSDGGFMLVATDNAGDDELWRFYSVTRGRDYIHLGLLRGLRTYLGKFNLTGHVIQAVLNAMTHFLTGLQADQHILGFAVNFAANKNSADEIRQGHITVGFAAEEASPFRKAVVESSRYRPAVDAMVADLAAQFAIAA